MIVAWLHAFGQNSIMVRVCDGREIKREEGRGGRRRGEEEK